MSTIIQFPKTEKVERFYKFLVKWSDGAVFKGDSVQECFRKQKDVFEPEYSMDEYLERFRDRLETVTGIHYGYSSVEELVELLTGLGYLEVYVRDDDGEFGTKFS